MPRKANDGRGRLGGRSIGTPNKAPEVIDISEWLSALIGRQRKRYEKDLKTLEPERRVEIITELITRCTDRAQIAEKIREDVI